jgi:hypothetical protein
LAGGALIVYITSAKTMKDGRPKYDPAHPDPEVVAIDVEGWWQLERHLKEWTTHPDRSPRVLVGAYGPPKHRFVIGAYRIAANEWNADTHPKGKLVKVPVQNRSDADVSQLLGRRIDGLLFGRAKWSTIGS